MNIFATVVMVANLALLVSAQARPECSQAGFFRSPEDCTRFYRCVDLTGTGNYQAYTFSCPAGTVFDEVTSVCNWPYLSAPCDQPSGEGTGASTGDNTGAGVSSTTEAEPTDTVVVSPTFNYQCTAPGFFPHASDCARFWLCRQDGGTALEPALYRCPPGYQFHDEIRRCLKEDEVECDKTPDLGRIAFEPPPIQLRVSDLGSFFSSFSFYKK